MRMAWLFAALPLLAGCGTGYVAEKEPEAPSVCEREANQNPAVKELMMKMAGQQYWRGIHQEDLVVARREALQKCLRQKGLMPAGGVEIVKPVWYDPLF